MSNRLIFIRLWQASMIAVSLVASFLVRFDFVFPLAEVRHLLFGLLIVFVTKMIVFYVVGIEHGWWRFSGLSDLVKLLIANVAGSALFTTAAIALLGPHVPAVRLPDRFSPVLPGDGGSAVWRAALPRNGDARRSLRRPRRKGF